MKLKMKSILTTLVLAIAVLGNLAASMMAPPIRPRRVRLANTYDAAVTTHEAAVNRTNDAAVTTRHLLWKKGAADGTVAVSTATDFALGTIDNVTTGTDENQSVLLLGKGSTKKMVANSAIAAGANVYAAAAGKVDNTGTIQVGIALTAAAADNDVIEVLDQVPTLVVEE
jgi:hypothetical protein